MTNHKTLVICTGASRGIGRAIALAVAEAATARASSSSSNHPEHESAPFFSAPLHLVLIARSTESLQETARLVEQQINSQRAIDDCANEEEDAMMISVTCHAMDLSDLDALPEKLQRILEPLSTKCCDYESCWLFNNAGSLGPLGSASSITASSGDSSMNELRKAIDFNVTSAIWISSQFTKTFLTASSSTTTKSSPLVRIINISSLCAIDPFPTMSIYCAGKAGREMFHRVLAKEHSSPSSSNDDSEKPTTQNEQQEGEDGKAGVKEESKKEKKQQQQQRQRFKVLNYAPGPCDTQMTDDLEQCPVLDDGLHDFFATSKREKKLVRPEDTARKLVDVLLLDEYESGSHLDYYDV
eukprot:CAMPEP_0183712506 /NCGR_PEP_ID=MMETSP0737-20130205/7616_1 /TAXON_ID=385413 /ORGANISM="Thalassiosira miniscula, Strain CCMP1093" /LENGTH=354 /DNA_ID=CAMNT_0025941133 /DNA_START=72 /DNA_END=1136 /DNA_ORIENTATION=+